MSNAKKFMFDNFVIKACDEENHCVEVLVPQLEDVETNQDTQEQEIAATHTPEVPPAKTYSEEEMQELIRQAEERGFEKGYRNCQESEESKKVFLFEDISNKILAIIADRTADEEKLEKEFMEMSKLLVKKFIPSILEENAADGIKKFLGTNFSNFKKEAKLSFYFNPGVVSQVQEVLGKLAHSHDFEGKISVHKDENLPLYDCRVEWKSGGVDLDNNKMLEKLDVLFENDTSEN